MPRSPAVPARGRRDGLEVAALEGAKAAAVPAGRLIFDAGWRLVKSNPSARILLGGDLAPGRHVSELLRLARRVRQDAALPAQLPASRHRVLRVGDGGTQAFLINYDRLTEGGGFAVGFEPAEWSMGFLDQIQTAIATTDERGVIVYVNRALSELLGFGPAEILGQPVEAIATGIALAPGDARLVTSIAARGGTLADTFPARLPGRGRVILHVHTAEWRYQGVPCGLIWSAHDQTEAEEAKRQEAVAFGFRLAALLQHELRNPLQTIQAAVEILRPMQPPGASRALALLEQQVRLISEYIGEQLQPPAPVAMTPQPLSAVVQAEIERSQMRLLTRLLAFDHVRPPNEPPVKLHAGSMGRAFANLFRNTAQARPDARIEIRYAVRNGELLCTVTDNGPGFPEGVLTGRWLAPVGGGLEHLGLAIVSSTVQAHGGMATMENVPGGGARVTIALPLADPPPGA